MMIQKAKRAKKGLALLTALVTAITLVIVTCGIVSADDAPTEPAEMFEILLTETGGSWSFRDANYPADLIGLKMKQRAQLQLNGVSSTGAKFTPILEYDLTDAPTGVTMTADPTTGISGIPYAALTTTLPSAFNVGNAPLDYWVIKNATLTTGGTLTLTFTPVFKADITYTYDYEKHNADNYSRDDLLQLGMRLDPLDIVCATAKDSRGDPVSIGLEIIYDDVTGTPSAANSKGSNGVLINSYPESETGGKTVDFWEVSSIINPTDSSPMIIHLKAVFVPEPTTTQPTGGESTTVSPAQTTNPTGHSLLLQSNGGSWGNGVTDRTVGASAAGLTAPVREGYTFLGWNTREDGSGKTWDFATDKADSSITLYAQWSKNEAGVLPPQTGGENMNIWPLVVVLSAVGMFTIWRRPR